MGKGARTRAANVEKMQKRREDAKIEAKKQKRNKILTRVGVAAVSVLLVVVIAFSAVNAVIENNGSRLRSTTAGTSANITIDDAVMSYYVHKSYNQFVNYYGADMLYYYYGFSTSGSLKRQNYQDDTTWFDYFVSMAKTNITSIVAGAEAAAAAGFTLTDEENEALAYRSQQFEAGSFGKGVKAEDVLRALKMEALSDKYSLYLQQDLTPTQAEIKQHFDDDPKTYEHVDYYSYAFSFSDDTSSSSTSSSTDTATMTKAEAYALAKELADCKDEDSFRAWLTDYLNETNTGEAYTEDTLTSKLDACLTEYGTYTADDDGSEWLFGDTATNGATTIIKDLDNGKYTVYLVTSAAAKDESRTVDVRHILVSTKEEADKIYAEWTEGGATEELFGQLAFKYSLDEGSYSTNGLFENVYDGQTVTSFNDWCFDSARKAGDSEIIESDYGFHIMFFVGEGLPRWQSDVKSAIITAAVEELNTQYTTDYPVTYDDTAISKIPA